MIKIVGRIPREICVAVSGGSDSMAVLDFLRRRHIVTVIHVNHATGEFADRSQELVTAYCNNNDVKLIIKTSDTLNSTGKGVEFDMASMRHKAFDNVSVELGMRIVTGHHLDDAVEYFIHKSLEGSSENVMPVQLSSTRRPFIINRKSMLEDWCFRHCVPFVRDATNFDDSNQRSKIRNRMDILLELYPGIHKTVLKKITNQIDEMHDERK